MVDLSHVLVVDVADVAVVVDTHSELSHAAEVVVAVVEDDVEDAVVVDADVDLSHN